MRADGAPPDHPHSSGAPSAAVAALAQRRSDFEVAKTSKGLERSAMAVGSGGAPLATGGSLTRPSGAARRPSMHPAAAAIAASDDDDDGAAAAAPRRPARVGRLSTASLAFLHSASTGLSDSQARAKELEGLTDVHAVISRLEHLRNTTSAGAGASGGRRKSGAVWGAQKGAGAGAGAPKHAVKPGQRRRSVWQRRRTTIGGKSLDTARAAALCVDAIKAYAYAPLSHIADMSARFCEHTAAMEAPDAPKEDVAAFLMMVNHGLKLTSAVDAAGDDSDALRASSPLPAAHQAAFHSVHELVEFEEVARQLRVSELDRAAAVIRRAVQRLLARLAVAARIHARRCSALVVEVAVATRLEAVRRHETAAVSTLHGAFPRVEWTSSSSNRANLRRRGSSLTAGTLPDLDARDGVSPAAFLRVFNATAATTSSCASVIGVQTFIRQTCAARVAHLTASAATLCHFARTRVKRSARDARAHIVAPALGQGVAALLQSLTALPTASVVRAHHHLTSSAARVKALNTVIAAPLFLDTLRSLSPAGALALPDGTIAPAVNCLQDFIVHADRCCDSQSTRALRASRTIGPTLQAWLRRQRSADADRAADIALVAEQLQRCTTPDECAVAVGCAVAVLRPVVWVQPCVTAARVQCATLLDTLRVQQLDTLAGLHAAVECRAARRCARLHATADAIIRWWHIRLGVSQDAKAVQAHTLAQTTHLALINVQLGVDANALPHAQCVLAFVSSRMRTHAQRTVFTESLSALLEAEPVDGVTTPVARVADVLADVSAISAQLEAAARVQAWARGRLTACAGRRQALRTLASWVGSSTVYREAERYGRAGAHVGGMRAWTSAEAAAVREAWTRRVGEVFGPCKDRIVAWWRARVACEYIIAECLGAEVAITIESLTAEPGHAAAVAQRVQALVSVVERKVSPARHPSFSDAFSSSAPGGAASSANAFSVDVTSLAHGVSALQHNIARHTAWMERRLTAHDVISSFCRRRWRSVEATASACAAVAAQGVYKTATATNATWCTCACHAAHAALQRASRHRLEHITDSDALCARQLSQALERHVPSLVLPFTPVLHTMDDAKQCVDQVHLFQQQRLHGAARRVQSFVTRRTAAHQAQGAAVAAGLEAARRRIAAAASAREVRVAVEAASHAAARVAASSSAATHAFIASSGEDPAAAAEAIAAMGASRTHTMNGAQLTIRRAWQHMQRRRARRADACARAVVQSALALASCGFFAVDDIEASALAHVRSMERNVALPAFLHAVTVRARHAGLIGDARTAEFSSAAAVNVLLTDAARHRRLACAALRDRIVRCFLSFQARQAAVASA